MTLITSSAVTTRSTPGTALAALVSIDLMRPWATVERNTLPYSIPGKRRLWVYSARPVTFSRASSLGSERPIWLPGSPVAMVALAISVPLLYFAIAPIFLEGVTHRAAHIDPQQLALVGRRATHIGYRFGLVGSGVAGAPQQGVINRGAGQHRLGAFEADRFLGRGAHH